jgi:hypothetical protein
VALAQKREGVEIGPRLGPVKGGAAEKHLDALAVHQLGQCAPGHAQDVGIAAVGRDAEPAHLGHRRLEGGKPGELVELRRIAAPDLRAAWQVHQPETAHERTVPLVLDQHVLAFEGVEIVGVAPLGPRGIGPESPPAQALRRENVGLGLRQPRPVAAFRERQHGRCSCCCPRPA